MQSASEQGTEAREPAGNGVCLGCSRCGDCRDPGLYARMSPNVWLCSKCWREVGQPEDAPAYLSPSATELFEAQILARLRAA